MKKIKNNQVMELISELKKLAIEKESKLWKRIATELERSTRSRREVNVYKLDKYAKEGETIIVPGKVLGSGNLSKKITVAALSFSDSAKDKITSNKGEALSILEIMKKDPKSVRIMG